MEYVISDSIQEVFTEVELTKFEDPGPTAFHIFWIVPNQSYTFQTDLNQDGDIDCTEFVEDVDLAGGETIHAEQW